MKILLQMISKILISNQILEESNTERFTYGMEVFLTSLIEILSVIIISVFVGNFFETIVFFAAFIPLRIYAGGYHADTRFRCYLILIFVYSIFTILVRNIPQNLFVVISEIEILFSLIIVVAFSPIINNKKTVNQIEKNNYRRISLIIIFCQTMVLIFLMICFRNNRVILSAAFGQLSVSLSMIAALIKNLHLEKGGKKYVESKRNI